MKPRIDRRTFLKLGLLAPALPRPAVASLAPERRLALHNLHTEETLERAYWAQGSYLADALAAIDYVLRDHRSGEVAAIDTALIDLLHRLETRLQPAGPFEVISAYRSPASNQLLNATTSGVATRSLHMQGKAIDIRIPGIELADVRRAGLALKGGGVGYYPGSNFVHLDVGRVRTWGG